MAQTSLPSAGTSFWAARRRGLVVGAASLVESIRKKSNEGGAACRQDDDRGIRAVLPSVSNTARLRDELPALRALTRARKISGNKLSACAPCQGRAALRTLGSSIARVDRSGSLPIDLLPSTAIAIEGVSKSRTSYASASRARSGCNGARDRAHQGWRIPHGLRCVETKPASSPNSALSEFKSCAHTDYTHDRSRPQAISFTARRWLV